MQNKVHLISLHSRSGSDRKGITRIPMLPVSIPVPYERCLNPTARTLPGSAQH